MFFVGVNEDGKYVGAPVAEIYMRRGFTESMCLERTWGDLRLFGGRRYWFFFVAEHDEGQRTKG